MHSHRQNPGFGQLCDAVAYRRLVVVTGSGVSVGLAQPGFESTALPTWLSVLTQLRSRFGASLGPVAADLDLLLSWTGKAAALDSVCRQVDSLSEAESGSRHAPRARKYLEALVARWRATSA